MKSENTDTTTLLYLTDSYATTTSARILEVIQENKQTAVILDQTLFYPQGGGQPADHGTITGANGSLAVSHVSYNGGRVLHKGTLTGLLAVGETVQCEIDWPLRHQHMQMHTAGHILDQAVKNVVKGAYGVEGDHGIGKRCFVEFNQPIDAKLLPKIQKAVDEIIAQNLPITTEMTTGDVILQRGIFLPFKLPKNKELRLVQIGEYQPMPDGGTQLTSTGEAWPITLESLEEFDGHTLIHYSVGEKKTAVAVKKSEPTIDIVAAFAEIEAQLAEGVRDSATYFGKKSGSFTQLAKQIPAIEPAKRKEFGQKLQTLKQKIEAVLAINEPKKSVWLDPTMPGNSEPQGHRHPINQAISEIRGIFEKIGFTQMRYPEVEWDYYAFEALNMPPNHPARDEWETFFVEAPAKAGRGKMILTPQTSSGQVREMERLGKPPIRMINIARCYRRQQDVTHTQMFHQFEGLVVDKGITIQHLKGTIDHFAREFYGPGTKSRIRPFHFQFTEPSFEVDFSCSLCGGSGKIDGEKCRFCKSGWHEVGGAGMVHPNVLKTGGIDPDEYTGFAFGWGIERTYALRPGLHLDDIRLLFGGDLRFLQQF